ncbi:eukaryotic translation initiation factor SUI1 family protein [Panus rudis PR-1116 ss-1]|nr:eukaryotic translation initiation factor SUI1 family protein [Panus rudis PR-1116 ss-1]
MFKKPLSVLKTSAPLRSSDRRKLKQRIIDAFSLTPEDGELLVPDPLLSQKFNNHVDEQGVAYLSSDGDPLWFTIGKDSDELIPTIYTLWKKPDLLPFLSTPAAVVPKLIGGADLMIPGVVQHSPSLQPDQLVSITQYYPHPKIGAPIAVGKMAVSSDLLSRDEDLKGKAVYVVHTWKDHLWDLGNGKKLDVPEPRELVAPPASSGSSAKEGKEEENDLNKEAQEGTVENQVISPEPDSSSPSAEGKSSQSALTPEDISHCLRSALLQAISTSLSSLPPSSFPIPASTFWSNYVFPARPALALVADGSVVVDSSKIDIKHSTHKSVKTFLKACAKEGLVKLKENKGDVVVTAVFPKHTAVISHRPHKTVQSIEAKREKAEEKERQEREAEERRKGEIQVTELWKPLGPTVPWFVAAERDTSKLYTLPEIRQLFLDYVAAKQLVNPHEQQYVNVAEDEHLYQAVSFKNEDTPEFLKRDDALKRIRDNMQSWHEMKVEGSDPIRKKGPVKPISVVVKIRQGRKAATLVTGFENFFLNADELAEELRKICASSTSVTPLPGKSADMEVMVQGKQIKAVTDFLISKGVPKKWIEAADLSADKKKK